MTEGQKPESPTVMKLELSLKYFFPPLIFGKHMAQQAYDVLQLKFSNQRNQ